MMVARVMSPVFGSNSVWHTTQRRSLFGRGEAGVNGLCEFTTVEDD